MSMEGREESTEAAASEMTITQLPRQTAPKKKKNKLNHKRRFSDEQIRLLESIFESDTKLEPRKKLQLARELGLQPRQVAIWFQNRRARWKSKQIEHEFKILRAKYESLASRYESLKKEKESLLLELQAVNELLGKPDDKNDNTGVKDLLKGNCRGCSDHKSEADAHDQAEANKLCFSHEEEGLMRNSIDIGNSGEVEGLKGAYIVDVSAESSEKFDGGFDSCCLIDPSCSSSHWLNFWV